MRLGYELVKEQLFFRKEVRERVHWFIRIRWIVVGLAVLGTGIADALGQQIAVLPIGIILFCIACCNILFFFTWKRLNALRPKESVSFTRFAHAQISVDLLALYGIIYFTGGIYSPLLIFVIFHIILAGILLQPLSAGLYGVSCIIAVGVLNAMQRASILPVQPILFNEFLPPLSIEFPGPLVTYIVFSCAILITVFLVSSVKLSLRNKSRELLNVSKELEDRNAKLTALYEMVKELGMCSDLQELMDTATRRAAQNMGVKACSIKLLDDQRKMLIFASTYGLSEDYLAKGVIDIEKSPINKMVIQGTTHSAGKIEEEDYFQYPEDIKKEGISSMECLPLRVEGLVLGVFCVYSDVDHYFVENDVKFFSLMADMTALAIENLRRELNKTWFLQKAAHQLRAPLNSIYSMLTLIGKGYLGAITEEQEKTVKRCEKRIEMLGDMINDLLQLGIRRSTSSKIVMHPVDTAKIMRSVKDLYEAEASEKGVAIAFNIDDTAPEIMADERLLDDLFTNLLSNAIKYTPPGGTVRVTLAREGATWVRLEVSDTGIGIPEQDLPRLFSEFHRAENAKAFEEQGTGLGLVMVKEILDALRGSISLNSAQGQGTTFTCLIPITADALPAPDAGTSSRN